VSAKTQAWYEASNRTWGQILRESVTRNPDQEIIVCGEQRLTYDEFYHQVQAFASGLLNLGVTRGDHTAIWMMNCAEWMVAQFAAYEIGSPLVPINTRMTIDEVSYMLEQSDASTLVMGSQFIGPPEQGSERLRALVPEIFDQNRETLHSKQLAQLKRVIYLEEESEIPRGVYSFDETMDSGASSNDNILQRARDAVEPTDVCNLIYTSGTTGFPKGGLSMHQNNLAAMGQWIKRSDLQRGDRMYLGVPFATNFGCAYVSQLSVLAGCTVVAHDVFNPTEALKTIQDEKITWFPGAPTMYIMMLNDSSIGNLNISSLRAAIVGGAPCPPETIRAMKEKMGFNSVIHCYGLSECGGLSTSTLMDDPIEKTANTVGIPFDTVELRITDPANETELPAGTQGEIWLRDIEPGSCVGKGYYNMADATSKTITADGWFRTGDLGTFDTDGYLSITGRVGDMFLVGGYNAYPAEIEAVLHTHPTVKMAQVFGVPDRDQRLGEVGCAYIELKSDCTATEEELIEFCKDKLANYKVPRHVVFISGEEFPLTASGKVRKFMLRDQAIAHLGFKE
jgi:fatty-acyl-CoA synthase